MMQVGVAFAIFTIVVIVLMLFFCLLLKFYSFKLNRLRREVVQHLEMQEEVIEASQVNDGAYRQYKLRQQSSKKVLAEHFQGDLLIDQPQTHKVFDITNNIYGLSNLKKGLQNQFKENVTCTNRFKVTNRQFSPDFPQNSCSAYQLQQCFTFLIKLVKYTQIGLLITEIFPETIEIQQSLRYNKEVQLLNCLIDNLSPNFRDLVEINGFQLEQFGHYKYMCVMMTKMAKGQKKLFKNLKYNINKQLITQQQYDKLLSQLINS